VIDPKVTNRRAITFYGRLGFETVGQREFNGDSCLVMRLACTRDA
jgi:ribosomal protein S18 acetylase RimI-like enzyme